MTPRRERPMAARSVKKTKQDRSKTAAQDPVNQAPRLRAAVEKIADQEEREFRLRQRALVRALRRESLDAPLLSPLEQANVARERAAKLEVALAVDDLGDLDPRPRRRPTWLPTDVPVDDAQRMVFEMRDQGYGAEAIAQHLKVKWPSSSSRDSVRRTVTNWLRKKRLRKT